MTPIATDHQLDPRSFREWAEEWREKRDLPIARLAHELRIGERRLRHWLRTAGTLDRDDLEDALHRMDVCIWDVYPDLDPPTTPAVNRGGVPAGVTGRLRDTHFRVLHRIHIERGMSVAEMSRRLYEQFGYASPGTASYAILRGWKRLGLPVKRRHDLPDAVSRCKGLKTRYPRKGERCTEPPMIGSDYCREHSEERRAEVIRGVTEARARIGAAA
jgi:hypothetical protein